MGCECVHELREHGDKHRWEEQGRRRRWCWWWYILPGESQGRGEGSSAIGQHTQKVGGQTLAAGCEIRVRTEHKGRDGG